MVNVISVLIFISSMWMMGEARIPGVYSGGAWQNAHATFYGGADASGTMGMLYVPSLTPPIFASFHSYPSNASQKPSPYFTFFFPCRRGLWLWELVQPRVRSQHGGTEHGIVQQGVKLRCLLRDKVCQ